MAVSPLLGSPKPQFFDRNGEPLDGGMVEFYQAGTGILESTFTTSDGDVANANPIVLNSRGEPPEQLHGTEDLAYKVILKDSDGDVQWTIDKIFSSSTIVSAAAIPYLNATIFRNAAYTVVLADRGKLIACLVNTFTIDLLPTADATEGYTITVVNNGDGIITLDADGNELINGQATATLQPGEHIILTSTGLEWNGPQYIKGIPILPASGTEDAMTADFLPNLTHTDGTIFQLRAVGQITIATPSLAIDGLPARTITRVADQPLKLSDISRAGQTMLLTYDAASFKFFLLNPDKLEATILTTPELLVSSMIEDDWTLVSSPTLSVAKARFAIVSVQCEYSDTPGGFVDYYNRSQFHLRQTGSALANDRRTRRLAASNNPQNVDSNKTIYFWMAGEANVSLDGDFDFDYYLTSEGVNTTDNPWNWDIKELYLVGYYS